MSAELDWEPEDKGTMLLPQVEIEDCGLQGLMEAVSLDSIPVH